MYCKLSVFIIILISVIVFIILLYDLYPTQQSDNFSNVNQIDNDNYIDGKMNFNYLVNPSYTNNILQTYYFNDDNPGVYHPHQLPIIVGSTKYYGNSAMYGVSAKYSSDIIYNNYGIRI